MSTPQPPSDGGAPRPLSPSKTPEARRLQRFSSDPRYGPKLAQLPKGEQTRILGMIKGNQGKAARKELLATHQARRDTRNARDRTNRLNKSVDAGLRNLTRQLPEAHKRTLQANLENMTWSERRFAQTATRDELRERARSGTNTLIIDGKAYNPFWYNYT